MLPRLLGQYSDINDTLTVDSNRIHGKQ